MSRKHASCISLLAVSPTLIAFCSPAAQQAKERLWVWVLIILLALLELWLIFKHCMGRKQAPSTGVEAAASDDLERIEGIGPKISSLLKAAGIQTFTQLAATDVERLKHIVREEGGITIADPSTWPEQAALAAAGEWDKLQTLQDELLGGRRT